jgi:hypothetical protein
VLNDVAQSVIEAQRSKHKTPVHLPGQAGDPHLQQRLEVGLRKGGEALRPGP